MTVRSLRHAVSLLPRRGTTGIGSLPHTQLELGLQMALQADIPYLPQLPAGNPSEYMIPAALEGLPGLRFDEDGMCTVDLEAWRAEEAEFGRRIEEALARPATLADFEPSPEACRAWRPFLWEVEHRKLALAKVQIAGPFTVRGVARTSTGRPVSDVPELDQQIFRLVLVKSLALVGALRRVNTTPLLFLDEPGLYALEAGNARHVLALQELRLLVTALQREGSLVGLHCCGNTDWARILALGINLLSVDVRLSLDAVLDEREAFLAFLEGGGALSLGIIPTNLDSSFRVEELVDAAETSLRATLPAAQAHQVLEQVLLTPACGLAMRTVGDAELVVEQVREAQKALARVTAL